MRNNLELRIHNEAKEWLFKNRVEIEKSLKEFGMTFEEVFEGFLK